MVTELPKMKYKGKDCVVDFKLEEMRCGRRPIKFIKFTAIKAGVRSKTKKNLRRLRAETWGQTYIRGIDD